MSKFHAWYLVWRIASCSYTSVSRYSTQNLVTSSIGRHPGSERASKNLRPQSSGQKEEGWFPSPKAVEDGEEYTDETKAEEEV